MAARKPLVVIGGVTQEIPSGDVVAAASGGTGLSTYAIGDLIYASGVLALSKLADVATGNALISGGVNTAPSWGKITSSHVDSSISLAGHTHAHSAITGLTSGDDHTQYALLSGRSGGQTLIGGTASGNNLTLQSTSHSTRGAVAIAVGDDLYIQENGSTGSPCLQIGDSVTGFWFSPTGSLLVAVTGGVDRFVISAGGISSSVDYISPVLNAPALGTPVSGVLTNCTGTASGLTAGNVTTNANLTGPITSVGNATSIASQTGTGTKFVVDTSPVLITPTLGVASATSLACPTFTSSAAIGFTPAAGSGFNITLSGAGDFAVNTNQLYVDSSTGNVGIGTTNPESLFNIVGSAVSEGTITGQQVIQSSAAYSASPQAGIVFKNKHDSSGNSAYMGSIRVGKTNGSDGSYSGFMAFDVRNHGAVGFEAMRIINTGNVGIGTTSPNYKSTIDNSSGNYFASALLSASIGTSGNWVGQLYGYTGNTYQKAATIFESSDSYGRGKFYIALNDATNSGNVSISDAKLTVDYNGNVGIGTPSPGARMDVVENIRISRVTSGNNMDLDFYSPQGYPGVVAKVRVDGDGTANYFGALSFWTGRLDTGSLTERMRIMNNGNVGIGITAPTALLHLGASTTARASLCIPSGTAPTSPVAGDIWYDGTNLKFRDGGTTRTLTWV